MQDSAAMDMTFIVLLALSGAACTFAFVMLSIARREDQQDMEKERDEQTE